MQQHGKFPPGDGLAGAELCAVQRRPVPGVPRQETVAVQIRDGVGGLGSGSHIGIGKRIGLCLILRRQQVKDQLRRRLPGHGAVSLDRQRLSRIRKGGGVQGRKRRGRIDGDGLPEGSAGGGVGCGVVLPQGVLPPDLGAAQRPHGE